MPYPAQKTSAEGDPLVPGTTLRWSNVTDAVDHSMAATIEDVLRRRTPVHLLDRRHGADLVHRVAGLLSERLGLAPEEISRQIAEYNEAIHLAEKGLGRGPA
jgi:glycerol-3-phosphate dehydrogenase